MTLALLYSVYRGLSKHQEVGFIPFFGVTKLFVALWDFLQDQTTLEKKNLMAILTVAALPNRISFKFLTVPSFRSSRQCFIKKYRCNSVFDSFKKKVKFKVTF
jgi:hypothetical protein